MKPRNLKILVKFGWILLVFFFSIALGQTQLNGQLAGPSGGPLVGCLIQLLDVNGNLVSNSVQTGDSGYFEIFLPSLDVGTVLGNPYFVEIYSGTALEFRNLLNLAEFVDSADFDSSVIYLRTFNLPIEIGC